MGKYVKVADRYADRQYRARDEKGNVLAVIGGETPSFFEDVPSGVLERLNSGFLVEVPAGELKKAEKEEAKEQSEAAQLRAQVEELTARLETERAEREAERLSLEAAIADRDGQLVQATTERDVVVMRLEELEGGEGGEGDQTTTEGEGDGNKPGAKAKNK